MANAPAKPTGRGGMTISVRGDERILGFWPDTFTDRSTTTYLGKSWRLYQAAMAIAQKRHEQNRAIIMAKASRREVQLPEPAVRQSLARAEQKRLSELKVQLQEISDQAFLQKAALRPFDYASGDLADVFKRQELRSLLRELPQQDRLRLVQKYEYRRAALEQPAEVSALPASEYTRLYEAEVAARFPDIVEGTTQALEAVKIVERVIETANEAVNNELIASGSTIATPEVVPQPEAWVQ